MKYNLHTHHYTNNDEVVELVNQYPKEVDLSLPSISIGIHPWYINEETWQDELLLIEKYIEIPQVLALGECGLDKRIDQPIEMQKKVFEAQLILAEKYKKPVVLHCVAAYQESIAIKKDLKISVPLIIHGFSKNYQVAKSLLDQGFYISFGKYLLRNPELSDVFKKMPLDQIFLETDMMEETIFDVYQKAENILGSSIEMQIERNFNHVFNQ